MRHRIPCAAAAMLAAAFAFQVVHAEQDSGPPKAAPEYQASPRSSDGRWMALTVQKLERGFDPPRPLLIWAIGSSFTNGLGNGDFLVERIRQRFPAAREIVYKKIAGNSTSYHFSHGWARHLVIPDQPDVVLLYNFGKTEDLERLIAELRRNTTADIIVGSLHWCIPHKPVWPDPEAANSHQEPQALRALCEKYGVEFVENRREMTEYMIANTLTIEDLLRDSVHESPFAARMTVMNIARHFQRPDRFGYDPAGRERRIEAEAAADLVVSGPWDRAEGGAARSTPHRGSELSVPFTGNRIELIGWRGPGGGTAEVWIDGKPADQIDAFCATYIQPDPKNAPNPPNPPRDRCPHAVSLGKNLVPQRWTLTMTSDQCDYELVGSATGPDGKGNALKPFTSDSGQIVVEPGFWRDAKNNRTGDCFTFEVVRSTVGRVDFKASAKEKFRLRLATGLANQAHVLKLVVQGDGAVTIDALDVFEPPWK
ncbi:MAG: SGNH/GDSL hydrolase family protein [Pirellulales bacterium]|nr:SGNH/GDSL hydrolase family protein [Pirellulales bacterium]